MTAVIHPFKRPRPVPHSAEQGDCWRYALREARAYLRAGSPRPALRVVRGVLLDMYEHAWIERGGCAYDWQGFATDGWEEPIPIAEFYERRRPRVVERYTAARAIRDITAASWRGRLLPFSKWVTLDEDAREQCGVSDPAELRRALSRALDGRGAHAS